MKRLKTNHAYFKRLASLHTIAILTVVVALVTGCSAQDPNAVQTDLKVRAVETEAVTKKNIGSPVEQVAEVTAVSVIDVVPKVSGQVVEVIRKKGDYVEKGDILFRIDSKDAESNRQKNELALKSTRDSYQKAKEDQTNNHKDLTASVEKAKIELTNAQNDYNKLRNSFDSGLATEHDITLSRQKVDTAQMNLESAQNKLAANDSQNLLATYDNQDKTAALALEDSIRMLDHYNVKAPAGGILTDFELAVGQSVSTTKVAGQVQQIDPIKITTELSENNYQLVKAKSELVYYNPDTPDKKITVKISYMAPIMSSQTKNYTLELGVPNADHAIKPGSRVLVQLTTESEQSVIAIPALSAIREGSDTYVFVQQADQYQKRKVKLGRINGQYQEVLLGLNEGELLVVTGQNRLKDGQMQNQELNGAEKK
ncbi:efflux RND transporter periplasmic adaptor subunit [Paenibacillus sp. WQ 127069]|uniref:Efflux RND transporter periplasmic adaptor subunit n=1 Tax=Paenibacillus baimaensis TaxID=2982185 RepID=A0ABT2UDF1_9BACL|nr:efflux RND transporter periplasmic adaptor subunit [Paenibacillus sp. WQ 127069]MCU6792675.1 efflux RND transporter periplasmic adaptor subunit [Paenibacillus sp. WQ 127069]